MTSGKPFGRACPEFTEGLRMTEGNEIPGQACLSVYINADRPGMIKGRLLLH